MSDTNYLDYSGWTVGTGSVDGWTGTGTAADENERLYGPGPWGRNELLWEYTALDNTGYGGGIWSPYFSADTDYGYQFSVFTNRLGAVGERTLYGCNAGTLKYVNSETTTTNPYFYHFYNSSYLNEWMLMIAHIRPYGYPTTATFHPNGGRWRLSTGSKLGNMSYEYRFTTASNVSTRMRCFYYDATDKWPTFVERLVYPRIERMDGTESTPQALMEGWWRGAMVAGVLFK